LILDGTARIASLNYHNAITFSKRIEVLYVLSCITSIRFRALNCRGCPIERGKVQYTSPWLLKYIDIII
jgi:hypothetical protein